MSLGIRGRAVVSGAFVLMAAGSARGDDGQGERRFGSQAFIVSADRLLPLVSYQSIKTNAYGSSGSETQSRLSVALLDNGGFDVFGTFYNLPRIAFDWLPIRNLTLGTAAWVYTDLQATDTEVAAGEPAKSTDQQKVTYWGVAPRVGYVIALGDKLSVWPRVGVEYHHVSTSGSEGTMTIAQQFAFEAEAMLAFSPWNHIAFEAGPTADIPISGSQAFPTSGAFGLSVNYVNSVMLQVGFSAGMFVYF